MIEKKPTKINLIELKQPKEDISSPTKWILFSALVVMLGFFIVAGADYLRGKSAAFEEMQTSQILMQENLQLLSQEAKSNQKEHRELLSLIEVVRDSVNPRPESDWAPRLDDFETGQVFEIPSAIANGFQDLRPKAQPQAQPMAVDTPAAEPATEIKCPEGEYPWGNKCYKPLNDF